MFKKLILFSFLILLFLSIMLLWNINILLQGVFLWEFLSHKLWLLIILGVSIFISWKEILDSLN